MTFDRFDRCAVQRPFARMTSVYAGEALLTYAVVDKPLGAGVWIVRAAGHIPHGDSIAFLERLREAERTMSLIRPNQRMRLVGPAEWRAVPSGRASTRIWLPQDVRLQALMAFGGVQCKGGNSAPSTFDAVGDLLRQQRIYGVMPVSEEDRRAVSYCLHAVGPMQTEWLTSAPSEELLSQLGMPFGSPVSFTSVQLESLPKWKRNALFAEWRAERRRERLRADNRTWYG